MNKSKASLVFIVVTILLDAIGIGIVIPILPDVIRRFDPHPAFVNHYYGYFIALYALMQFVASPILGSLSDRYGRRPVLLISLLGAGLDYILMAFAPTLFILFLGRFISGLTGASMTVASSYMADISKEENRAANFGMIGASFGVGLIIGPMLGGIIGSYGAHYSFLLAAVLSLLNFLFGLFVLPESLPKESRRPMKWSRLNPFTSISKVLIKSSMMIWVWIYFLLNLAGQSHPSIWTLYTQYKFGWTSLEVGMSLAVVGVTFAFGQGYLTRIIIPRFGEFKSVLWGTMFQGLGFILYAIANQGWMMYAIITLFSITGITLPALQNMISRETPSSEQGELQGSLVSIASFTSIIAPLMYTELFNTFTQSHFRHQFAGAPYAVAAIICFGSFFLVLSSKSLKVK